MKNLLKKNQLMITALAIMIAIAGYLQFAGNNLEEEYLETGGKAETKATGMITDNYTAKELTQASEEIQESPDMQGMDGLFGELEEIDSLDSDVNVIVEDYLQEGMEVIDDTAFVAEATPQEGEIPGEAIFTATTGVEILTDAKLLKEQTRAKNKETLLEIINSAQLDEGQKQEAVNGMVEMTQIAEMESAAEILLEAKGFSDVVVSISKDEADVVVNALELTEAQRAQIEDIVCRKTGVAAEDVIISTITK